MMRWYKSPGNLNTSLSTLDSPPTPFAMGGKGKGIARDTPNLTPSFNVEVLQQMITALQLVIDRDEGECFLPLIWRTRM